MIFYKNKKFEKFISNTKIKKRISDLSLMINKYYKDEEVVILCVLDGAIPVFSELTKNLNINYKTDYIKLSSYKGGTKSAGTIDIEKEFNLDIKGKKVLIVEDIVDTGTTINFLNSKLFESGVKEIKVFSLLLKRNKYKFNVPIDWYGFDIEDLFTIGYGMDYDFKFRGLKDIYIKIKY